MTLNELLVIEFTNRLKSDPEMLAELDGVKDLAQWVGQSVRDAFSDDTPKAIKKFVRQNVNVKAVAAEAWVKLEPIWKRARAE